MGSTRLPNKMMLWLHGFPVIFWIYHRLCKSKLLDSIIFAVPKGAQNDPLVNYICSFGGSVFEGPEKDVLSRFYGAAKASSADIILRVCGDNPFVCGNEIDNLITFFENSELDYAYNHVPKGNLYPDGIGAEITNFSVLKYMHQNAFQSNHREHVFNFLLDNSHKFKIGTFDPEDRNLCAPLLKLDIDTTEDYSRLLKLEVNIDSTAAEIVNCALNSKLWRAN